MIRKISTLIFSLVAICLVLTACERPASVAPVTEPTSSSEIPFPVATQPQIMKDILAATQTAAYIQGTLATGGLTEATSTQAFVFITPTSSGSTSETITFSTATPSSLSEDTATKTPTATPTEITYATPTPGIPGSYTLHEGEFPYCIARRFDVNPADLLAANGLNMYSVVSEGTKLKIPQSSDFPGERALKDHPTDYTVVYGDTVYTIACAFGDADPNTIMAANGLDDGDSLSAGQTLYIP